MANTKYLNQVKLTGTFTPNNSAIVASDDGQTVAEKTQGQINAMASPSGTEPVFNGLENSALFSVTYSAANRQFSVTYSSGAAYTVGGVRYTTVAGTVTTTAHANTTGTYYLYYDSSGNLTVSSTFWNLLITAPIASVYYNNSNNGGAAAGVLQCELHPGVTGMSNATHLNLHTTRGTQLLSGCVATGYTLNTGGAANVNWTTSTGSIADEDLILSVTSQALGGANTYRILYLTGTTGAPVWNWKDVAEDGIYSDGTDVYYNQNNAGTWQLTAVTNNSRWVNYYIVATTAYNTPQIIVVMGQNLYTSLSTAQAGTFGTDCTNFGLFTNEAVVLYKVTYRRNTPNGAPGNVEISAFTQIIQNLVIVALSAATQASNVSVNTSTFTNFFTAADNNVQQALNDLDAGFPISLAHGGTGKNLTASTGGIFYSGATTGEILSGTATANRTLLSGSSAAPAWSTATYPATTTANQLLYSSSANTIAGLPTGNSSVLVTDGSGVPSLSTTLPAVNAGSCTCTDPTTSSSASINTALSDIYNSNAGKVTINIQTFTSSGTYTPTAGMVYCTIECWGGGGGGGGAAAQGASYTGSAGGGGAGGYSKKTVAAATIGASKAVTIGNYGSGGSAGNNAGNNGTATSVGTICVANGGTGGGGFGNVTSPPTGGAGGTAGTGDIAIAGQAGSGGVDCYNTGGSRILSGSGGSTAVGSGGSMQASAGNLTGVAATGYGAGGGGAGVSASTGTVAGGNGAPGFVYITEYILTQTAINTATNIYGGVANNIPYQTAASTTSFITPVNNAVLASDGSGVPSMVTTLPAVNAGSCTCTDPTTSSSASVNTALSDVYNSVPYLSSSTVSTGNVVLSTTTYTYQQVTGASITLAAGKYLLICNCSLAAYSTNVSNFLGYTALYDGGGKIASTEQLAFDFVGAVASQAAAGATTICLVVTPGSSTTYSLYAKQATSGLGGFSCTNSLFTAIKFH